MGQFEKIENLSTFPRFCTKARQLLASFRRLSKKGIKLMQSYILSQVFLERCGKVAIFHSFISKYIQISCAFWKPWRPLPLIDDHPVSLEVPHTHISNIRDSPRNPWVNARLRGSTGAVDTYIQLYRGKWGETPQFKTAQRKTISYSLVWLRTQSCWEETRKEHFFLEGGRTGYPLWWNKLETVYQNAELCT